MYPAPACNEGGRYYYKEKELSFTKIEDVYKRSLQAAKKGRVLTFHWRGGYLTKEVLKELLEEGKIGRLMTIQHMEEVGYWHQAHSL